MPKACRENWHLLHDIRTSLVEKWEVLRCNVALYSAVEGHGTAPSMIMGISLTFTFFRQVGYMVEYYFVSFITLAII